MFLMEKSHLWGSGPSPAISTSAFGLVLAWPWALFGTV